MTLILPTKHSLFPTFCGRCKTVGKAVSVTATELTLTAGVRGSSETSHQRTGTRHLDPIRLCQAFHLLLACTHSYLLETLRNCHTIARTIL